MNLCFDHLAATAMLAWPCRNNFKSILARALEMITAFEESARLVAEYRAEPSPTRAEVTREAKIVPPTSQNQGQVERDLAAFLPGVQHLEDAEVARRCEHLIRNYDPASVAPRTSCA